MVMWLLWQGVAAQAILPTATPDDSTATATGRHMERRPVMLSDTSRLDDSKRVRVVNASGDTITFASLDSIRGIEGVEILTDTTASPVMGNVRIFNPDPQRALWLSALCPGLGQIYNRRYWKLPIVVGAFVDDPDTRSYMDFFPPTVKESDLDVAWLQKVMKNKRDYYRRYREICVIAMVGVYLINIVDAYVDASLAHFDISPDLTLDVAPAAIDSRVPGGRLPSLGLQCAISF